MSPESSGWKTTFLLRWHALFFGDMLVFGGVDGIWKYYAKGQILMAMLDCRV